MRFEQRGFLKFRGGTQARAVREVLRAELPPLIARDLSHGERFDLGPLASDQVHHRSISTQCLLLRSYWRLGRFLLKALHLRLPHHERCLPGVQGCSTCGSFAHLHAEQFLQQLPRCFVWHPARQSHERFLHPGRQSSIEQS